MTAVRKMLQTPAAHDAAHRVISCFADVRGEKESDLDDVEGKAVVTVDQYSRTPHNPYFF